MYRSFSIRFFVVHTLKLRRLAGVRARCRNPERSRRIVKARLPESSSRLLSEQFTLPQISPLLSRQQCPCSALFYDWHYRRWSSHRRFGNQNMDVLRHNHIADDDKVITHACLFENGEESFAGPYGFQKWQSVVAGTGDKVQVVRTIGAMQAARHTSPCYRQHRTRPCKKCKSLP
jgi:hypothetical protein